MLYLGLIFVVRAKNAEFLPYWKIVNIWHAWDDKFCDMYFQVKVIDTVEVFIGWEWEARILERFCEYTVDGVPGWGVSEWHYRHFGGRPQKYEDQDPPEVKDVPKYWQVTPKQNISEIYIQYGGQSWNAVYFDIWRHILFFSLVMLFKFRSSSEKRLSGLQLSGFHIINCRFSFLPKCFFVPKILVYIYYENMLVNTFTIIPEILK